MYKVIFSPVSTQSLEMYISRYREYYLTLYGDTGIWSQDQIIHSYILESTKRKEEIIQIIVQKLSQESVT